MSEATAALLGPGDNLQADRAKSDLDDPDLGATALADDAIGGDGGAGGFDGGGGMETWPDDDEDEDEPCPAGAPPPPAPAPLPGLPPTAASASGSRALPCSARP